MIAREKANVFANCARLQSMANRLSFIIHCALNFFIALFFFLSAHFSLASIPEAGFFLPDNVPEVTFKFKRFKNLILLPVTINDTIKVNLILDTGCRNLLLFGKRFEKLFNTDTNQKIQFSGLGQGQPVNGKLSVGNRVSIHAVLGEKIPLVIVPNQNLFSEYSKVDGIIGYDIFIKFEIELDPARQLITFRPAAVAELPNEYTRIPLRISDCVPLIQSKIFFSDREGQVCDLMLDTGSALGLLVKTTDLKKFPKGDSKRILGRGLNGDVVGIETTAKKLILDTFEIESIAAGVTSSAWHNYASVGMDIMKDYAIVLNYCKAYAGFKNAQKRI